MPGLAASNELEDYLADVESWSTSDMQKFCQVWGLSKDGSRRQLQERVASCQQRLKCADHLLGHVIVLLSSTGQGVMHGIVVEYTVERSPGVWPQVKVWLQGTGGTCLILNTNQTSFTVFGELHGHQAEAEFVAGLSTGELKEICEAMGAPTNGTKEQLLDCLWRCFDSDMKDLASGCYTSPGATTADSAQSNADIGALLAGQEGQFDSHDAVLVELEDRLAKLRDKDGYTSLANQSDDGAPPSWFGRHVEGLRSLSTEDLQQMCSDFGLHASGARGDLLSQLEDFLKHVAPPSSTDLVVKRALERAADYGQDAVREDCDGNYRRAVELYLLAANEFKLAACTTRSERAHAAIVDKCDEYMSRVRYLEGIFEAGRSSSLATSASALYEADSAKDNSECTTLDCKPMYQQRIRRRAAAKPQSRGRHHDEMVCRIVGFWRRCCGKMGWRAVGTTAAIMSVCALLLLPTKHRPQVAHKAY